MRNRWMDRISDFVDGDMSAEERALFEGRLAEDAELRRAVGEVQTLVTDAASLGPIEPPESVWTAIEAKLTTPVRRSPAPRPRTAVRAKGGLIAAGVALMLISAAAGWLLHDLGRPAPENLAMIEQPDLPAPEPDAAAATFAEQEELLGESIRRLELLLEDYGSRLDPDTREAIAGNLEVIDRALADAHQALREDPNSAFLHSHITNSLEQKVRLLEDAARLASMEI